MADQSNSLEKKGTPSSSKNTAAGVDTSDDEEKPLDVPDFPILWVEWREHLALVVTARRLLRDMARIISSFHGGPHYTPMSLFLKQDFPLLPIATDEVLRNHCVGDVVLNSIQQCLLELSDACGIREAPIIEQALDLLSCSTQPRRIVFSVILQHLLGRGDFAEDLVRDASSFQINNSEYIGLANDTAVNSRSTKYYASTQFHRRDNASIVWQLELCLWLNRGGVFSLSDVAIKETTIAVRLGLVAATWERCHQNLETMIKAEPDCVMDHDTGKNLWRSMKILVVNNDGPDGADGVSSGGWEFLVDCRRDEATEMLRDGKPGQFLIRPHAQDPGVFTLSFKTNLVPTEPQKNENDDGVNGKDKTQVDLKQKVVKRDDVVQHAIVRLSDSGFRCGSFGPFTTLVKLLQAVSDSLPFNLRFDDPPIQGIINERGVQASPNSFLFRKMSLHSNTDKFRWKEPGDIETTKNDGGLGSSTGAVSYNGTDSGGVDACVKVGADQNDHDDVYKRFGLFTQLLFLTELRKQLCAVAAAQDNDLTRNMSHLEEAKAEVVGDDFDGSISEGSLEVEEEELLGLASRMVRPLLSWCRSMEVEIMDEIAPSVCDLKRMPHQSSPLPVEANASGTEFEIPSMDATAEVSVCRGDAMIRKMIQAGSGVEFRTLRVGEAGNSVIVVLFSKSDALQWLISNGSESSIAEAMEKLKVMEQLRIIEPITSSDLSIPKSYAASHPSTEVRYRFVDPWEVEALESKAGETASASLGRGRYQSLNIGFIANACEKHIRALGGLHLLGLWGTLKGGIYLTKAIASVHSAWERDTGGDLRMKGGFLMEPSPYENSIRQHLYGNSLFRRLEVPQRFIALMQVELLDLKNVTSPSGASTLTAYALLRLKRQGSSAPLNHKARSLDSACTQARKISKISGPNAPASWGSVVRFRFPLPEDVNCEGISFDRDTESLFKGAPSTLQITVYEKKFMSDVELGRADVKLDALGSGGQLEEWVPLHTGKDGITWFARIRLTLRFELLCIESPEGSTLTDSGNERCPSVGLKKIRTLSRLGAHEDSSKAMRTAISTPDLVGYFGNMLS